MKKSKNDMEMFGMLVRPEDFALKVRRWSGCSSKIFMKFTI
jgi:hypothetical protein